MAKLVVKFDERVLGEYPVEFDVTIGRLPGNTVVIDNPAVSGHHARIFVDGDDYIVEDMESKNGTYVNEKHVLRAALRDRDVLLVGKHRLVFDQQGTADAALTPRRVPTLGQTAYLNTKQHRELLAKLRAQRAQPQTAIRPTHEAGACLRVVDGPADDHEYLIPNGVSFIGTSEEALVRLHGWWKSKTAAAIVHGDAGFTVTDFDGSTLVNNQPLVDGSQQLKDGDVLEVGGLLLEFMQTSAPAAEPRTVSEASRTSQTT